MQQPQVAKVLLNAVMEYGHVYNTSIITGCAVAQHCCIDDQQSQWENGDFDPL